MRNASKPVRHITDQSQLQQNAELKRTERINRQPPRYCMNEPSIPVRGPFVTRTISPSSRQSCGSTVNPFCSAIRIASRSLSGIAVGIFPFPITARTFGVTRIGKRCRTSNREKTYPPKSGAVRDFDAIRPYGSLGIQRQIALIAFLSQHRRNKLFFFRCDLYRIPTEMFNCTFHE